MRPHGPHGVHAILQARILKWAALPFPRGSSQPRDGTHVSHIAGRFFINSAIREALMNAASAIDFPLSTVLAVDHSFCYVASSFTFSSVYILFLLIMCYGLMDY